MININLFILMVIFMWATYESPQALLFSLQNQAFRTRKTGKPWYENQGNPATKSGKPWFLSSNEDNILEDLYLLCKRRK